MGEENTEEKKVMRWSRTDVEEDFDRKLLTLAHDLPLAGKGFYSILRNLIYLQAPKPFTLDDEAWKNIKITMPAVPRKRVLELLEACIAAELFDRDIYQSTGEITSRRIDREIGQRFGDMARKKRERNRKGKAGQEA